MDVDIEIARQRTAKVSYEKAVGMFDDLEALLRLFPKLRLLTKLGEGEWLWQLEPLGTAGVSHVVSWASRYTVDKTGGTVRYEPIAGKGNAMLSGEWRMVRAGSGVDVHFKTGGKLSRLDVPFALRPLAGAFVKLQFSQLIDEFLDKIVRSAEG